MPIQDSFRNSIEKLDVKKVAKKYHQEFKTIIVTFQSKVLSNLLENNVIEEVQDINFGTAHSKFPIYKIVKSQNVLFFLSPIGAPTTVGILEEITYTFNIKNIIMYGSCGVLDKEISGGNIIVPTKAYRDEGTSYHYQLASDFIEINNADKVSRILDNFNIPYVKGYTWTTDAFYRETEEIYSERKKQGCIAVEMEVSAVQAFANYRGYNLYSFIYGADNLDSIVWEKRVLGTLSMDNRYKYFQIAQSIADNLN